MLVKFYFSLWKMEWYIIICWHLLEARNIYCVRGKNVVNVMVYWHLWEANNCAGYSVNKYEMTGYMLVPTSTGSQQRLPSTQ